MSDQVHWSEGLFLQPHHLQLMQRRIFDQFGWERRLGWSYPYGVVDAQLSSDALENHSVRFSRLVAVLPSGREVSVPQDTDLPPINIKQVFESSPNPFIVYLGVPLYHEDRPNTVEPADGDNWRPKRLFHVRQVQLHDENIGKNPQPVDLRRVNARLLVEGEDKTDLETIPLVRISRSAGKEAGLPQQDRFFIPPCLVVGGSSMLRAMVRELANQIEASRKIIKAQLAGAKFNADLMHGAQFKQVLQLGILSRYSATLPHLAEADGIAPFELYLQLKSLLGEMAALRPHEDDFEDVEAYDHLNPAIAFQTLDERIRRLVRPDGQISTWEIELVRGEGGICQASLTDEQLTVPVEYFLAVKSHEDPRALVTLIEDGDKFKLTAQSLIDRRIYGLSLREERQPPVVLQQRVGTTYFRVAHGGAGSRWEDVKREKTLACKWAGSESSDLQLILYMTLPEAAARRPRP